MLIGLFASFFLEIFAIIAVKSVSSQDSEYITVPAEPTFEDPLVVDASNAKATNSNLRKVLHPSYVKPSYGLFLILLYSQPSLRPPSDKPIPGALKPFELGSIEKILRSLPA